MTTCNWLPLASIQTNNCDFCQATKNSLEEDRSSNWLIDTISHVQTLIDFISKTIDSLLHLLCCGTCSLECEERVSIWQI